MKTHTLEFHPLILREIITNADFGREVKPGNLQNAINNIFTSPESENCHTIKLYADDDIKDGWHHLNALCQMVEEGIFHPHMMIEVEVHN